MHTRLLTICHLLASAQLLHAQVSNDHCDQAIDAYCYGHYILNFAATQTNPSVYVEDCSFSSGHKGLWYKLVGSGNIVNVSVCNSLVDIQVFTASCDTLHCVQNTVVRNDPSCGLNSERQISFRSMPGIVYYIYCSTQSATLTAYLEITCVAPSLNDECQNATNIEFDSIYEFNARSASQDTNRLCDIDMTNAVDLWYIIEGDGQLLEFSDDCDHCTVPFNIFRGSCFNMECIQPIRLGSGNKAFQTHQDSTYYLQLRGYRTELYHFKLSPVTLAGNWNCISALDITEVDTISLPLNRAPLEQYPCTYYRDYGVWYTFSGTDSVLEFTTNFPSIIVNLYTGDCENLVCEKMTTITTNASNIFSTQTQSDKIYFLLVHSLSTTQISYSPQLVKSSGPVPINNTYQSAIPLSCNDSLKTSLRYALRDSEINNYPYPSIWFQILGTGEFYSIKTDYEGYYPPYMTLYKNNDESFEVLPIGYPYVYLEKDSSYYLNYAGRDRDSFGISLSCMTKSINDVCHNAIELTYSDTLIGNNLFSLSSPVQPCEYGSRLSDVWYRIQGNNTLQDISFESNGGKSFDLLIGTCDDLTCAPYSIFTSKDMIAKLRAYLKDGETYYLRVYNKSESWDASLFKIFFQQLPIAVNDHCESAREISCGDVIIDSLDNATAEDVNCIGQLNNTPAIWYKITGQDQIIELRFLNSSNVDISRHLSISIFVDECEQLTCIYDSLYFYRNKIVFLGEMSTDYYLLISDAEKFSLSVSCEPVFNNDLIEGAIEVHCGEAISGYLLNPTYSYIGYCRYPSYSADFWFRIEGTNEFIYREYDRGIGYASSVFELQDGLPFCVSEFKENRFFADSGKTYFLRFEMRDVVGYVYDYDFDFKLTCHARASADFCNEAPLLGCGESIRIDNTFATDDTFISDCQYKTSHHGLWYRFIGLGSYYDISLKDTNGEPAYQSIQDLIYTGSCDYLICVRDVVNNTIGQTVFYAESGKIYYLNLGQNFGVLDLSITCVDEVINNQCQNALSIYCGDTVTSSLNYVRSCDYADQCEGFDLEKRIWYSFVGSGDLVRIDLEMEAYNRHFGVEIYTQSCCAPKRITNLYGSEKSTIFLSEKNVEYLIAAKLDATHDDGDCVLSVHCLSADTFKICESAPSVENGQLIKLTPTGLLNSFATDDFHFDDKISWIKFRGSGGIDTLTIVGRNALFPEIFIDVKDNCQFIKNLEIYTYEFNENGDTIRLNIPTLADSTYAVAVNILSGTPDTIEVSFQEATNPNQCSASIAKQVYYDEGQAVKLHPIISGSQGPFDITIRDAQGSSYYQAWTNGQSISFTPYRTGYKILEYRSEFCNGETPIEWISNTPPPLICPDSSVRCLGKILHDNQILVSNKYRSNNFISSNSKVEKFSWVEYQTGKLVNLLPNFSVEKGATFEIKMQVCDSSNLFLQDISN